MTARIKRARYEVRKVYVIICRDCNEDITRPVTGEDVTTRAEAEEVMAEHDKVFHGQAEPDGPADAAARSWAGWPAS